MAKKKSDGSNGQPKGTPRPEAAKKAPAAAAKSPATLEDALVAMARSLEMLGDNFQRLTQAMEALSKNQKETFNIICCTNKNVMDNSEQIESLGERVQQLSGLLDTIEFRLSQQGLYRGNGVPLQE